jgi:hypothetical protein
VDEAVTEKEPDALSESSQGSQRGPDAGKENRREAATGSGSFIVASGAPNRGVKVEAQA